MLWTGWTAYSLRMGAADRTRVSGVQFCIFNFSNQDVPAPARVISSSNGACCTRSQVPNQWIRMNGHCFILVDMVTAN